MRGCSTDARDAFSSRLGGFRAEVAVSLGWVSIALAYPTDYGPDVGVTQC